MFLLAKDLVKFSIAVGLAAIFFDAAIAHGLLWENDPYWTYWVTKTFLITSVFLFGTALVGAGILQGAALTAVHTLILEIYYQWLAPVGLPQEPQWLDFNHLWTTGVPAHFISIFTGYLLALWLWRRNREDEARERVPETSNFAIYALLAAVLVVILDGLITQLLLLRDFPGITFFVQRVLIAFVFIAAWTAYAGVGFTGWVIGALLLAMVWTSYGMYLGPRGLPLEPPTYSGYRDLWLLSFPGAFIAALGGWWVAGRLMKNRRYLTGMAAVLFLLGTFGAPADLEAQTTSQAKEMDALHASASASGAGMRVVGPDPANLQSAEPIEGEISVEALERGNRWSHVQNTDGVQVRAVFASGGANYEVVIDKPMPRHPLGRYTTWFGVAYEHEMHGDTGVGTGQLPKVKPAIALWGWADVKRNNQLIARNAPAHVMVTRSGPLAGIMLEVDTEERSLMGEPDGHLTVMWPRIDALSMPERQERVRMVIGWAAMIGLALLFFWLAFSEGRKRTS